MTTTLSTKEKILETAAELFAEKGFDGTSVRDIAKAAEVNLAAINYHFKNKENLYLATFMESCERMEANIDALFVEGISIDCFVWKLYESFVHNGAALMNSFKMMLTTSVSFPEDYYKEDDEFGPPGQETLLKVISQEVSEEVSLDAKKWAVHVIFTHVVHNAIIMSTSFMKEKSTHVPILSKESKMMSISIFVRAVINEIKRTPKDWELKSPCGG